MGEIFIDLLNTDHHQELLGSMLAGFTIEAVQLDLDEGGIARSVVLFLNDDRQIMIATPSDEGLVIAEGGIAEA